MKKILFLIFLLSTSNTIADVKIVLETGAVWQHRNDLKIPGDSGTRLDFDEFNPGPFLHYRTEVFVKLTEKHNLRLLYAPFQISVEGPIKYDIDYNGETFSKNEDLEINYKFNSYRLTYYFTFWDSGDDVFGIGLTGKVRDAEIELKQSNLQSNYDNLGFVPLLYFIYQTSFSQQWYFNFNMDAAAAPQGRAFDIALGLRNKISPNFDLGIGLRTLEGGADNDKVMTFSWFNYAVVDLVTRF